MGRTKSLSVIAFSASAVIMCAVPLPKVLDKSDGPADPGASTTAPCTAAQDLRNVVSSADPGTESQDLVFVPLERCALTPLAATPDLDEYYPATDPSGATIAYVRGETDLSTRDLVIHDTETSKERVLLISDQLIGDLSWSPDGTKIAFWQATDSGKTTIDVVDVADGTVEVVSDATVVHSRPRWSPDGSSLSWVRADPRGPYAEILDLNSGKVDGFAGDGQRSMATWSPDARLGVRVRPGAGQRKMASQCCLQLSEFFDLVDCLLDEDALNTIVAERCVGGRNPFLGP